MQHQHGNCHILHENQTRLPKCAERELLAHIVGQGDEVRGRLEEVGEEGDARGGFRVDELEQLWDFDDGGGAYDADAEAFGDGELEARGGAEVEVVDEVLVARLAEDGDAEVCDGRGQVLGDGLEKGA